MRALVLEGGEYDRRDAGKGPLRERLNKGWREEKGHRKFVKACDGVVTARCRGRIWLLM